jgi:multidrug efflux pump subunit AcrB
MRHEISDCHFTRHDERCRTGEQADKQQKAANDLDEPGKSEQPPGASLARTEKVVKRAIDIILTTRGIEHVAPFAGLDAITSTVASNSGTIFSGLPSLYNHSLPGVTANSVLSDLRKRLSVIKDATVLTTPPPPVQGLGSAGCWRTAQGSAVVVVSGAARRRRYAMPTAC